MVDQVHWVKVDGAQKLQGVPAHYLWRNTESAFLAKRVGVGAVPRPNYKRVCHPNVITAKRRIQSQKPSELYELVEQLVPDGAWGELFGRRNNLRRNWVTIGNQIDT